MKFSVNVRVIYAVLWLFNVEIFYPQAVQSKPSRSKVSQLKTSRSVVPAVASRQSLMDIHRLTPDDLRVKIPKTRKEALDHLGIMVNDPSREEIMRAYDRLRDLPVNDAIRKFNEDRVSEYNRSSAHWPIEDKRQLAKDNDLIVRRFNADQQAAKILLRSAK